MHRLPFYLGRAAGAAAILLAFAAPAAAGLLDPGETGGGEEFVLDLADPSFQGETLASSSTPFEFNGTNSSGEPVFFRGTFNTRVVRESATGTLAFHYQFLRGESNQILDFENFYASSFRGLQTDVFSDQTSLTQGRATRSADGKTIDFVGDEESNANLVVRTDATAFAAGGTARTLRTRSTNLSRVISIGWNGASTVPTSGPNGSNPRRP